MNPRYVAYPVLKELDPIIEDLKNRLTTQAETIVNLCNEITELKDIVNDSRRNSDEAVDRSRAAYRHTEEIKREVDYSIDDLRRKVRI